MTSLDCENAGRGAPAVRTQASAVAAANRAAIDRYLVLVPSDPNQPSSLNSKYVAPKNAATMTGNHAATTGKTIPALPNAFTKIDTT